MNENKWYKKTWVVILLLIFFFPAGLFLMWKYTNWNVKVKWGITIFIAFILLTDALGNTKQPSTQAQITQTNPVTNATPALTPTPNPASPTPSPTPQPTDANGFNKSAKHITVSQLNKTPSAYQGEDIVFSCQVLSFPKDAQGNAAGINCTDPNSITDVVQVSMGRFDETVKVNQDDKVLVEGLGQGAATGKNAFGGDVTEPVVLEFHLKDLTTGWSE